MIKKISQVFTGSKVPCPAGNPEPVNGYKALYSGNNCSTLCANMMSPVALSCPLMKACIPLVCLFTIPSHVSSDMVNVTEGDS